MPQFPEQLAGAYVFPIVPGTKEPAASHWRADSSNDPAQIAAWEKINPDFNWGLDCAKSGIYVFDIDPDGIDPWAVLLERDEKIKASVTQAFKVRTPKGGEHVYYRGYGPSTVKRIADGIDTRGGIPQDDGAFKSSGYVVMPGSHTRAGPGRVDGDYKALPGGTIEPLPAFMLAIVPERKKTATVGLDKIPGKDLPRNIQTAIDLLKNYVASGRVAIEGKGGDNLTFQVAASILDKGISTATTFDLMWEHWNPHCSPPWDDYGLEQKIRNALEHGEDTKGGTKGFQANEDAFAAFVGQEYEAPEPIKRRSRFDPMWLRDARRDVKPAKWLIPGFIPDTGTGILYGLSGSYKTFLALDWALSLAHGIAGQWGAPPEKHVVLFLAGESSYALQQERVDSWCEKHELNPDDADFIIVRGVPAFGDTEGWQEIRDGLLAMKVQPSLIVIDTLTRMMAGLSENSNDDAKLALKMAEEMAAHYGAFVLAVGHTGKDVGRGVRGAQVFIDNSDAVFHITKQNNGAVNVKIKKLKEVDIPAEPYYLDVKKFGASIFLERTQDAKPDSGKTNGSRYDWASSSEVVRTLQGLGGETSMATLVQEIAGRFAIDGAKVRSQLSNNAELAWLRPDSNTWKIPSQEFDL